MSQPGALALRVIDIPREVTVKNSLPPPSAVPAGWATVAQWYVANEPDIFEMMADPVGCISREVEELLERCERRGIDVLHVMPSPIARSFGFTYSRAFPDHVLMEFFAGRD
jgi:hypothetical protein